MQIKVDENDICNKEYIYLDWNVIKYMKEPRENNYLFDMEFREVIKRSKTRYVYPFCEAHFMDRAHNFKEEYRELVYDDLYYLEEISEGYGIAQRLNSNQLGVVKYSLMDGFEKVLGRGKPETDLSMYMPKMQPFYIDKKYMDANSMFYEKFDETNGYVNKEIFDQVAKALIESSFSDIAIYKKMRENYGNSNKGETKTRESDINKYYMEKIDIYFAKLRKALSIVGDEEKLSLIWKDAIIDAVSLHYEVRDENLRDLICVSYVLLDIHPDFREKLKKDKNTLDNILRDGKNIWYASQAKYFVTEDKNTRKKAEFIYKVFGCKVKVCSMSEFAAKFCFV